MCPLTNGSNFMHKFVNGKRERKQSDQDYWVRLCLSDPFCQISNFDGWWTHHVFIRFCSSFLLDQSLVGLICFGVEGKSRWQWATSIIFGNGLEK